MFSDDDQDIPRPRLLGNAKKEVEKCSSGVCPIVFDEDIPDEKCSSGVCPIVFDDDIKGCPERDSRIEFFEDTHTYVVDGNPDVKYTSVTTVIKHFFSEFDPQDAVMKMEKSGNLQRKHPGKTAEQVKNMWLESGRVASEMGTNFHALIEDFYNGVESDPEIKKSMYKEYQLFQNFHKDTKDKLEPYLFEWRVFDEEHLIAGSIDAVFRRRSDGGYVIIDWKRSKEIKLENQFGDVKHPISWMQDSNFYKYSLQLNLYKFVLEKNYNIKIEELALAVFYPTMKKYLFIKLPFLSQEISDILKTFRTT
jgi:hypothetical protein